MGGAPPNQIGVSPPPFKLAVCDKIWKRTSKANNKKVPYIIILRSNNNFTGKITHSFSLENLRF